MTAEGEKSAPADLVREQATRFAEAADKIRARSETAAKGLAAVGTTAVGAVGITKFADIFPVPPGHELVAVGVIAGFIFMTIAVVLFSARLWRVSRPVYMRSDVESVVSDLDEDDEKAAVRTVYAEAARTNDASSLRTYEDRGWRLQRIALRQSDPSRRADLLEQSTLILTDVRTTQLRAAILLIRKRASSVASGGATWLIMGLFALGLIFVGVGADWLDSARGADDRRVATTKACADAMAAIAKQQLDAEQLLPESCGQQQTTSTTTAAEPPVADQVRATLEAIASHYRSCVQQAISRGETDTSTCSPQLQIIVQTSR